MLGVRLHHHQCSNKHEHDSDLALRKWDRDQAAFVAAPLEGRTQHVGECRELAVLGRHLHCIGTVRYQWGHRNQAAVRLCFTSLEDPKLLWQRCGLRETCPPNADMEWPTPALRRCCSDLTV